MSDNRYDPHPTSPHQQHDPVPGSPEFDSTAFPAYTQPLAGDDGEITGLGAFPNAHLSRFSQAASLSPSFQSRNTMPRSDSTYTDGGASVEGGGLYAPVTGTRPGSSLSSAAMMANGSSDRGSYVAAPLSSPQLGKEGGFAVSQAEKYAAGGSAGAAEYGRGAPSLWARKKKLIIAGGVILLAIIAIAVAVPVAVTRNSSSKNNAVIADPNATAAAAASAGTKTKSATGTSQASSAPSVVVAAKFGGKGTNVIMADGTEGFAYQNEFGGYWGYDPTNPTGTSTAGRAQSWSPALNETFNYGVDKIRGVNLGGWLNTEPFIVPGLYEKYSSFTPTPVDEWTLSVAMGADLATEMENHYKTFVTEQDFMEIAAAGFNYVRIPIGWWAIETWEGEPLLERVSWNYFLKAVDWARKYGLRINLDLHAVPGSQNAWNHSGRMGAINFLRGQMGIANAQRTLNYVRTLAQFIAQPEVKDVVTMFGILNEPFIPQIGAAPIESWYTEAYDTIRKITGLGEGQGPWISIHDGFNGLSSWKGFLNGGDRVSLDTHTYVAFNDPNTSPLSAFPAIACRNWGSSVNQSMSDFGLTQAGEFSMAVNDCGKWVTGVGLGTRWEGTFEGYTTPVGTCDSFNDWTTWDAARIQGFQNYALASMDALQNYFFWTWKIGNSTVEGYTPNPMWNYQLGLEKGWSPKDPRAATGFCASLGVTGTQFDGTFPSWHTGGAGAGVSVSTANAWPPQSMTGGISAAEMTQIPQFVMQGTPVTLPGPTYTSPGSTETIAVGNGWVNPSDTASAYARVTGCTYPDAWTAGTAAISSSACGAGSIPTALLKRSPEPTPAPVPAHVPVRH